MKSFKYESQNINVILEGKYIVWKRKCTLLTDATSFLFSGSYDNSIKFWNVSNTEFIKTFRGHTDWIMCLTLIESKSHLVSSSKDHTVKIWDLKTFECLSTLLHHRCVTSLLFILERDELITADLNGEIRFFNSKYEYVDSISTRSEQQNESGAWCLEYISYEDLLLIGTENGKIKIFNLRTKVCVQVISDHSDRVHSMLVINQNQIVTGSWDKTIKFFNKHQNLKKTQKFDCERTLTGHKFYVIFIAVIKTTQELISMSEEGTIKIWDIQMWKCLKTMTKHTDVITCCCLRVTSYECELLCDSRENEIRLWNIKNGKCKKIFSGHCDVVRCLLIYTKQNPIF